MSKFTYPKCPYCGQEYREHINDGRYHLLNLVQYGSRTEDTVKCDSCGNKFKVSVHITYYSKKLTGGQ